MIEFGKKYRDKISGFEGTATALTKYLHGSDVYQLERDGDVEKKWIEIERLESVENKQV